MAREPMVTRTVVGTKIKCMTVNTETSEVTEQEVVIGKTFKDEAAMLKTIAKTYDTDITKVVKIISHEPAKTRYGMKESAFIAGAEILPPLPVKEK